MPFETPTKAEFYAQDGEIFVTALSSLTRHGFLYRVDLRLRPDGKNGALCLGASAFLNYLKTRAAVWELLAYVKLRAAAGDDEFARRLETKARNSVHQRAAEIPAGELKTETARVRELLEKEKTKNLRRVEINIKHGAGGLLDIYFAVRFLQLRDRVPDEDENRSTAFTLEKLQDEGSLDRENFATLSAGYSFLGDVDHALRLVAGRSTPLPINEHPILSEIARRLKISEGELLEQLVFHTAQIRRAYNNLLS